MSTDLPTAHLMLKFHVMLKFHELLGAKFEGVSHLSRVQRILEFGLSDFALWGQPDHGPSRGAEPDD